MSDTLTVLNNGLVSVAFRILVSVPHRFSISVTDGILNPCQRMDIPVVLPVLPSEDSNSVLLAKLAVEFLPCDDDYYIVGPKAYWATNKERAFRKKITAELGQKGKCYCHWKSFFDMTFTMLIFRR